MTRPCSRHPEGPQESQPSPLLSGSTHHLGISCTPGPKAERGETSDTFNITQWTNGAQGRSWGLKLGAEPRPQTPHRLPGCFRRGPSATPPGMTTQAPRVMSAVWRRTLLAF